MFPDVYYEIEICIYAAFWFMHMMLVYTIHHQKMINATKKMAKSANDNNNNDNRGSGEDKMAMTTTTISNATTSLT